MLVWIVWYDTASVQAEEPERAELVLTVLLDRMLLHALCYVADGDGGQAARRRSSAERAGVLTAAGRDAVSTSTSEQCIAAADGTGAPADGRACPCFTGSISLAESVLIREAFNGAGYVVFPTT